MTKIIHVLFVCLGNICRSPMAEAIFMHKVRSRGLSDLIHTDSCGTGDYHLGEPAHDLTLGILQHHNIPINHKARQLMNSDFKTFHYLIAMDRENNKRMLSLSEAQHHSKIILMRNFDPNPTHADVPDPYFGTEADFAHVFGILERSTEKFLDHIVRDHRLIPT